MPNAKLHIIIILAFSCSLNLTAQSVDSTLMKLHQTKLIEETPDSIFRMHLDGHVVSAMVVEGDTIIVADLQDINISSPRSFANREDYLKYLKYRRYAAKVYPYAVEAIRIFSEAQEVSQTMKNSIGINPVSYMDIDSKKSTLLAKTLFWMSFYKILTYRIGLLINRHC